MTARDVWRWTDERGVQRLVGTDELRTALSSGVLAASTLVWRDGMKEWAPASSMPELASAAFAAESSARPGPPVERAVDRAGRPDSNADADEATNVAPRPTAEKPAFDPRRSAERRATLVGRPTPQELEATHDKLPVVVPSASTAGAASASANRPAVTQAPPFGAPEPDAVTVVNVPPAPRIPAAPVPSAGRPPVVPPKPRPQRRITTNEIDGQWAENTHSDADETIPRRARPSELAAAAAATAEANASLRDARMRSRAEALAKKAAAAASSVAPGIAPGIAPAVAPARAPAPPVPSASTPRPPAQDAAAVRPPARKPPPPVPTARARLDAPAAVAPKDAAPPHAPPRAPPPTPLAGKAPPLPRPIAAASVPTKPTLPAATGDTPRPPAVRIKPPLPVAQLDSAQLIDDLPVATAPAPFTMGVQARPQPNATLGGIAPLPLVVAREPAAATPQPAPVMAAAASTSPTAAEVTDTKPVRTLVSGRDSIDSIPGLADVVAASVVEARAPEAAPEAATAPGSFPSNGAAHHPTNGVAHPAAEARSAQPAPRLPPPSHPPPRSSLPTPLPPFPEPIPVRVAPEPTAQPAPQHPAVAPAQAAHDVGSADARAGESVSPTLPGDADVEMESAPKRGLDEQVSVPLFSLLGAGGLLIGMVITAFFVGRASSNELRLSARPAFAALPAKARAALPAPLKPCWMAKQPAMWAPQASLRVPFEVVAAKGGGLAVGYASGAKQAMGIEVDLATGEVRRHAGDKGGEEIERVVPTPGGELLVVRSGVGALRSRVEVPGAVPFALGLGTDGIALAAPPDAVPAPLWPLGGDEPLSAASVRAAGDRGFALVYRRGGAIWGGFLGADHKARGDLVKVAGSGGAVGKPAGAWNGRELAVIFADRPEGSGHYEIRVGHAAVPAGASSSPIPATTTVIPLPRGGPGGDAFAPEIAGLADGRWLLMWTEGAQGSRAVRAQTLSPDFAPLGDPIALSPPAGNFGQGVIGVVEGHAATVFLSKGASSYELWGAVLQCRD